MARESLVPTERWSLDRVLFGPEQIREHNLQRFEMEHLDAITHIDTEAGEIVGYKEVGKDEFWVRGHIPGRPLLPGVVMLEALAQLTSFFVRRVRPEVDFIGFGGLEGVRFRQTVKPGDRLVLVGKRFKIRSRQALFDTQGWVDGQLAVEGRVIGVAV